MRIFWKKKLTVKIASTPNSRLPPAGGGSAPRPPRYYFRMLLKLCRDRFKAVNSSTFYYLKRTAINVMLASSALLRLFFTSNTVVFVDGG